MRKLLSLFCIALFAIGLVRRDKDGAQEIIQGLMLTLVLLLVIFGQIAM